MTQPTSLPASRTVQSTLEEHLDDHAALHAFYNVARGGQRTTSVFTTAALAVKAREAGLVPLGRGYRLYRVATDVPARVRLYASAAQRDADLGRLVGTDPAGDHGLMLDYVTTSTALGGTLTPPAEGFDGGDPLTGQIPYTVDNLGTASGAVTVTLTYVRTE